VRYAGVGVRFAAVLVDGILLAILGLVVAVLGGGGYAETTTDGAYANADVGANLEGRNFLIWLALAFAYYVVCEVELGGTLGKVAVGLRVVDEDGDFIGWRRSVVRNLIRPIDFLIFYLTAAIAVWSSSRRQRLGDRLAGTFVVRT
jgi:uncharacterized RDD family membrane protein YckC